MAIQGNECNLRAKAIWGAADFLWATDRPQLDLEQDLQLRAVRAGQTCLDSYSHLCFINFTIKRLNYKLRPKWSHNQICFFCRSSSHNNFQKYQAKLYIVYPRNSIYVNISPSHMWNGVWVRAKTFSLVQIHIGKAVLWHFFKPFREKTPIDIRTLAKYPPEACVCTYGLGLEKFE